MYLSSFLVTLRRWVDGNDYFLVSRMNHLIIYKLSSKWPPSNRWGEQKLLGSWAFKHFLGTTTLPEECQSGQPSGKDILIFRQEMTCEKHTWFLAWNLERAAKICFLEDRDTQQLQSSLGNHLHFCAHSIVQPFNSCRVWLGRRSVGEVLTA